MTTYSPAHIRAIAATLLSQRLRQRTPFQGPSDLALQKLAPSQRSQIAAMIWGTYRYYYRYEAVAEKALEKPLRSKDLDIYALLLLGWHQLDEMRIKEHAVVHETVEATKVLKKPWAAGMINALLRHWPEHLKTAAQDLRVKTAHPFWLAKAIRQDWPEEADKIFAENNAHPPMTIRINAQKTNREEYLQWLSEKGMEAIAHPELPYCLTLSNPCMVQELPFFEQGFVSVQDSAAQWIGELIRYAPNLHILDACAAPGGKTAALLERSPYPLNLTALEKDPHRFSLLENTLNRCQLTANTIQIDALNVVEWWDKNPFDYILLDVPCSGTGVIRRHPDIKYLRTTAEIESLLLQQRLLLETLWPCLKPGGTLLYATCSLLKRENEDQIQWFCQKEPLAELISCPQTSWHHRPFGVQNLPGDHNADGFYYAALQKRIIPNH